jgi:hypothetical protein
MFDEKVSKLSPEFNKFGNKFYGHRGRPVEEVGVAGCHGVAEEADVDGHVRLAEKNVLE